MSFASNFNPHSEQAAQRRDALLARIAQLRALEDRAAAASALSAPVFHKRGQLLPRERVGVLLDPGRDTRHNLGQNVAFLDGHVHWEQYQRFTGDINVVHAKWFAP